MHKFHFILFIFSFCILNPPGLLSQQSILLHGTVFDNNSGEPLPTANIRIAGTSMGTISNLHGNYSLTLDSGKYTIIFSYLGYRPDTLQTIFRQSLVYDVRLKPSPVQIPEVVVVAEDPALEIIRKAIAHKQEWMKKIRSYQFDAFTRQVLRRDTGIASITESYTTGYWRAGDTLREFVKQKRQTENIPSEENFAAVRRIINFNDDEISLFTIHTNGHASAYLFTGPTAPDALEKYDYKLLSTSTTNGIDIYRIQMIPKTRTQPLFAGTITIADGAFAVMGVDVAPNEAFTFPFVKDIRLRYRQQFSLYEDEFWMPADISIEGSFALSIIGISFPRIGIETVSSIYNYAINPALPDTIFQHDRVTTDSTAARYDSTFWKAHEVLPLTVEEQRAYKTLDSGQTLEKQFQPNGPLASFGNDKTGSFIDHIDARFTRVEGFFAGWKTGIDNLSPLFRIDGAAGIGFSDQRFKYDLGATVYSSSRHTFGIGSEWYSRLDNIPDNGYYGQLAISLMSLIDKDDYRDYFLANGNRMFITATPPSFIDASFSFISEREYTLGIQSTFSFFSTGTLYRPNPVIDDGLLRSLRFDLRIGEAPVPLDLVLYNALEISIEHSSPSLMHSEFDFTRYNGSFSWNVQTFGNSLLFPPVLRLLLEGGLGDRNLPPQRLFILDSRASGYAPFGVLKGSNVHEFSGDRYVLLSLEHNFRSLPFLALDIPFLYRNSIELITYGAFAQTWYGSTSSSNGWYAETGIGLARIFDLLRADITYRCTQPRRFIFSLSIANLF